MARYGTTLPTGEKYKFEAPDDETAANAVRELHATAYGGGHQAQFGQAFGTSPTPEANAPPDNPELAAAMDERIHGEADDRGAAANIGNALTGQWGDEAMGVFGGLITLARGEGYEKGRDVMLASTRRDIANYRERFPKSALAQDIIGGAVTSLGAGGAALKIGQAIPAIGRLAQGAGYLAPAGARVVTSGLGGGLSGAVTGAGNADGGDRLQGAVEGAVIGAGTGLVAGGAGAQYGRYVGRRAANAALPTQAGRLDQARSAFRSAETSGVGFSQTATTKLARIRQGVMGNNPNIPKLTPQNEPHALSALNSIDKLGRQSGGNFSDVMTIRDEIQKAAKAARGGSPDQAASLRILDSFDDWIEKIKPQDLSAGRLTPDEAFAQWRSGREQWGIAKRTETVEKIVEAAYKKKGLGNARYAAELRKGFQKLLENPRQMKFFSAADKKAIQKVASGGNWGKTLGVADAVLPGLPTNVRSIVKAAPYAAVGYAIPGAQPVIGTLGAVGTLSRIKRNVGTRSAATRAVNQIKGGTGAVPYDRAAAAIPQDYATRLGQAVGQPVAQRAALGRPGDSALDLGSTFQPGTGGGYVPIRR